MRYEEHRPEPSLARHIHCYWFLTGPAAGGQIQPIVPDGRMELIVNLADRFLRHHADGAVERQPAALLAGQITRFIVVEPGGRVDLVGVRFRPAGAAALLPVPARELSDHIIDPALLAAELTLDLADRLYAAPDPLGRVRVLDLHFSRLRGARAEPDALVSVAVSHIEQHHGRVPISDLAAELRVHPRTLERRFRAAVGIAPKVLARIARFRNATCQMQSSRPGEWSRIAHRCGYYDQAHLIRDFRTFAGASPARFLAGTTTLADFFGGSDAAATQHVG